ncbi:MFS transporter [Fructilactobacillus fructivorans]|nr:MFS transporter [Fructilactobacillus fructivorans]KRK58263.1 major facilitator superfamily protein [Fructilactobacillus fructivorans]
MDSKVSLKTKIAILATALLSFCGILLETSMNVTFPELSQIFHISLNLVQWISTGYLLVVTITMATTAYLLKRFSLKKIFVFAVLAFIVGDVLCAIAPNFWLLLIGRLIQAAATGLSLPMMYQIIFAEVPRPKIGFYTGIASMVISIAPALGPTYGGTLSSLLSWRYIFIIAFPIVLITLFIGLKSIDLQAPGISKRFDFISFALLIVTLFSFVWGANQFGVKGATFMSGLIPIIIGLITLGLFIYLNGHGDSQLMSLHPLKIPTVSLNAVNYFLLMFINIGASFVIPIYAETVLHSSAMVAGLILLPGSIIGGVTSPFAGGVYDRFGAFKPIITGMVLLTIAMFLFSTMTAMFSTIILMLLFALLRFGFNCAFSCTITNAQETAPQSDSADVNSLFNMLQQYAGSIGTSVLATIYAFNQNQAHDAAQYVAKTIMGGHMDFLLLFVLAVAGLILTLVNWTIQRKHNTQNA